jgi:4-carboxymuconolactone decarboxylase
MTDEFFGRLRLLRRGEVSSDERINRELLVSGPRGGVTGPYKIWVRNGPLVRALAELDTHLNSTSSLSPADREIAILVCAERWDSAYVAKAHVPRAVESGVPGDAAAAILAGQIPSFADPRQELVYSLTRELYAGGALSDETFERAMEVFAQDGLSDLLALLGYYTAVALTLNAYAVAG